MKKQDFLFRLIKSLSPSEKGYFKKFVAVNGDVKKSKYIRLFEAMDGLSVYDDKLLRKKLQRETFLPYLAAYKNYLQRLLLKALNRLYSSISRENEVREILLNADILSKRGFYQEADKLLRKADAVALRQHDPLLMLKILARKRLAAVEKQDERYTEKFIDDHLKSGLAYLRMEENTIRCRVLEDRIFLYSTQKGFEDKREEKIKKIEREARRLERLDLPLRAKLNLYDAFHNCYVLTGNFSSAYRYITKLRALFEKEEGIIEEFPESYLKTLHNVMFTLLNQERYQEFWKMAEKIKTIPIRYPLALGRRLEKGIFEAYILELDAYLATGQFSRGMAALSANRVEQKLNQLEIGLVYRAVFYFLLACLYVGAGDFRSAHKWLSLFINNPSFREIRSDLFRKARILNLVIQIELGHADLLPSLVKSARRSLGNPWYQYEPVVLDFFSKFPGTDASAAHKAEWFKQFKKSLWPFLKNPREKRTLIESMVPVWIEGRISGKSMEEVRKSYSV